MELAEKIKLQKVAAKIRLGVIEGTFHAKSGHPGGSLSIADTLAYLYWKEMNIDPKNPKMEGRDRLVLSKGHTAPGLYAALAERGYFPVEELKTLRHIGSMLQGHPNMNDTPGVEMSTGSLGQGISAACGMALASKISEGEDYRVYTILGDGEIEEGQVWEAAMFAAHYKLDNLVAIIDNNNLQIDGDVREVVGLRAIPEKFRAFGWEVLEVDGHDVEALLEAFATAQGASGKPVCIVASTVKGKGVSFMETQAGWHGKAPNDEQTQQAIAELKGE